MERAQGGLQIAPDRTSIGLETPRNDNQAILQRCWQPLPDARLSVIARLPEEEVDARLHCLAEAALRQVVSSRQAQRRHRQSGSSQQPARCGSVWKLPA